MTALDLTADPVELTATLVDIPSESGAEGPLADAVEASLRELAHLRVVRDGDAVVAFTDLGRARRVVLAGHLDTVPIIDNVPSRREGGRMHGCGTSDMKSGIAVLLHLAATVPDPTSDVTFVCYDNEEVEAARNGLRRLAEHHADWLAGDLAVLLEPTDGVIEAGCQGTLRVEVTAVGKRAHSARSWLGDNAIHAVAPLLAALDAYEAALGRHRRLRLPRGTVRGEDQRRGRGQCGARRVHGHDQLPLRPRPQRGAGARARAGGARAIRGDTGRLRAGRAAGPARSGRA